MSRRHRVLRCVSAGCLVAVALLLGAACGRSPGAHFGYEDEPPEPIEWVTETCAYMGGVHADAPWPMFQRCPSHAGVSPHLGPDTATVRWSEPCDTTLEGFVVAADGSIFGCSDDVYQLASRDPADGRIQWTSDGSVEEGILFAGFPAIGQDGTYYVPNVHGVSAISAAGNNRWVSSFEDSQGNGALVISAEPIIYLADGNRSLLAISPDGTLHHKYRSHDLDAGWEMDVNMLSAYAGLSPDGRLILSGAGDSEEYDSLGVVGSIQPDAAAHQLFSQPDSRLGIPVLDGEGTIYIVVQTIDDSQTGALVAVSSSGETLWRAEGVTTDEIAPAIGPDGTVYVAAGGGESPDTMRAYSPGGQQLWETTLSELPTAHPVVDGAGTVYLGTAGYVVALKADGALLWMLDLEGKSADALALGADQTLYVQTESTMLAIGE